MHFFHEVGLDYVSCSPFRVPIARVAAAQAQIAKAVNATVISLDEAPQGYKDFDKGAAKKYVLNPNGYINA